MSNLPVLTINGSMHSLPGSEAILNPEEPYLKITPNSLEFRPVKQISNLMNNYALAAVEQVEVQAQRRLERLGSDETNDDKTNYRLSSWETENIPDVSWMKRTTDNGLLYVIVAAKNSGEYEKFEIETDKSRKIQSARWLINGFLPGELTFSGNELQPLETKIETLAKLKDKYIRKNKLNRLHHILCSEANWLLKISQSGFNGGIEIGGQRFYSKKVSKGYIKKELCLVRYGNPGDIENSNQLIVRLNDLGNIEEIEQVANRSDLGLKLVRHNGSNIEDKARLEIYDFDQRKRSEELIRLCAERIDEWVLIEKIMSRESAEANQARVLKSELEQSLFKPSKVILITSDRDSLDARLHREKLFSGDNLSTLGRQLGLVYTGEAIEGKPMHRLMDYAGLASKQLSLVFFQGGIPSVDVTNVDDQQTKLSRFGDVKFRDGGPNADKHVIRNDNFRKYLEKIGVNLTSSCEDNAICRWNIIENENALRNLGIVVERADSKDKRDKLHFLGKIGADRIKKIKLKILAGIEDSREVDLNKFPSIDVINAARRRMNPKAARIAGNALIDSETLLKIVFEDIGFEIADSKQTDDYLSHLMRNGESTQVEKILKQEHEHAKNIYLGQLALSLAERYLREQGFSNVTRIKVSSETQAGLPKYMITALKGSDRYVVNFYSNSNSVKPRQAVLAFAEKNEMKPMLLKISGVDPIKRIASEITKS